MDLTAQWQLGKCRSVECFVAAVTTFLTNHFSALHLPDPLQIGLTCSRSVPPIIFCAYRQLPLRSRLARTLLGSQPAIRAPSLHLLIQLEFRKKAPIFCSAEGCDKWASYFPISTCQVFLQPQCVGQSLWQSQCVCVCVCSVPLHAVLTHVETSEITFRCCLLIPKTARQRPLCDCD